FTMRRGAVILFFHLNIKSRLDETSYHERFVQGPFKGVWMFQSLYKQGQQLGIVGAEIQVVSQLQVQLDAFRHVACVDAVALNGMRLLKITQLLIPLHEGMALRQFLLQFGVSPLRREHTSHIREEEIMKGSPLLIPVKLGADRHQTIAL